MVQGRIHDGVSSSTRMNIAVSFGKFSLSWKWVSQMNPYHLLCFTHLQIAFWDLLQERSSQLSRPHLRYFAYIMWTLAAITLAMVFHLRYDGQNQEKIDK